MTSIQPSQLRPIQDAWEALSNALRNYSEARLRAPAILKEDAEEAVANVDRAFEQKLEKFHTLYDLTKSLPGFAYFTRADTSLILVLRNAIHHRDHELFVSWNSAILLDGGLRAKAGAAYLVGSQVPFDNEVTARFCYRLHDFYRRLAMPTAKIREPEKLRALWDTELGFEQLAKKGEEQAYPEDHVYVNVMPVFISAVAAASRWLVQAGFTARGYDGKVYLEHFREIPADILDALDMQEVRVPVLA